ncbi:hypothetical protein MASSI9I_70536 [Massilia sp. 9I]|nr:hypothetical protein MASSI9I_70536 [Massilia sp. 9I]
MTVMNERTRLGLKPVQKFNNFMDEPVFRCRTLPSLSSKEGRLPAFSVALPAPLNKT